jgi:hypothetical protein
MFSYSVQGCYAVAIPHGDSLVIFSKELTKVYSIFIVLYNVNLNKRKLSIYLLENNTYLLFIENVLKLI